MRGTAPFRSEERKELNDACIRLYVLGLIGVLPGGVGFGNVSVRVQGDEFLISGTATGDRRVLTPQEYCLVKSFNIEENRVTTLGPVRASSESMSHSAVYCSRASVMCVIHIHSRKIFDAMIAGGGVSTPPEAAYGTPEMALAIASRVTERSAAQGVMVLAGHDEGAFSYGSSVQERWICMIPARNLGKCA